MPTFPLTFDLALQGGGTKGIALSSAIAEILRRGHVIRRVVGTSAGAIVAALVTAGFSGDELVELSVRRTQDDHPLFFDCTTEPIVPMSTDVEPAISKVELAALKLPTELGRRLLSAHAADTMVNGTDLTVSDSAAPHVCRLPANGYRATEFDMSQARAEALVNTATAVMARYLDELERDRS